MWLVVSRRSFDENQRNHMTIKQLRHNQQRSMFPQKSPFFPLFGAFYPHFAIQPALRAAGASRFPAPSGKRVATFALVTTVGPQPRPARSTPGEPGRAANRQAFASLSYLTHRQVVRNPHVERSGFLVSTSRHPRTAVRRGRHAGLLLITVLPKKVGTIPTYIVYDIVTQCFDHEPLCGAMRVPGFCEAAR